MLFVEIGLKCDLVEMDRVVDVEAGQDREDIGLQESDEDFQSRQSNHEGQRHDARDTKHGDETGNHLNQRVPCEHIREEPHRQANRARKIGNYFDWYQQGQHIDRSAGRREEREEMHAVTGETEDRHTDKDEDGHRKGNGDVAGEGEAIGQHAEQIAEQHEHKQSEDDREITAAFLTNRVFQQSSDEFIGEFDRDLPAARHNGAPAHAENEE